ncbi:CFEM domain [Geosmithia morbida]|uniref:CFEM domain n=1 Tax=Geosmithia morbida TaxID=1094350 RepID=A0A9P5D2J1_9HYPO|nr:CFEM domain [Geosmithia morbida]KAF4123917.1 CFEM domain [Geosmithia morbida]
MKSSSLFLSLAAAAGVAVAQLSSLSDLPSCAKPCASEYTTGGKVPGCSALDLGCICGKDDFVNGIACCLADACSVSDRDKAISVASDLCSSVGTDLPESVVCKNSTATSTITAPSTSATDDDDDSAAPRLLSGGVIGAAAVAAMLAI